MVHTSVTVDRVERNPAVETEFYRAFRVLAGDMVAVFIFHEGRFAFRAIANILILNGGSHFFKVECGSVTSPVMILCLAEFTEYCLTILAN
jgi:hypothetical protein